MSEHLPVMVLPYSNREASGADFFFTNRRALDDTVAETETEAGDAFSKFVQDAELAATLKLPPGAAAQHVHNFHVEAQERDAAIRAHYSKLASDAAKAGEKPAAAGDDP